MFLPNKYMDVSKTLIWYGAIVLKILGSNEISLDNCWDSFKEFFDKRKDGVTYNKFLNSLTYLYIIGAIEDNGEGELYNVSFRTNS